MRRIMMILGQPFPPDIRVEKEALALIGAGFEVSVVSFGQSGVDNYRGIKIFSCPRTHSYFLRATEMVRFFLTHNHPKFSRFIAERIREFRPRAIHIHDIPFFRTAYLARVFPDIKIVSDLHENFPQAFVEYRKSARGIDALKFALQGGYEDWVKYERWCLERSDGIIVVTDEARERIANAYNIDRRKIEIVSNTVEKDFLRLPVDRDYIKKIRSNSRFVVLYLGGFGPHRGLDTTLRAIAYLRDKIEGLKLLLVGAQRAYIKELIQIVNELKISDMVEIKSWEPYQNVKTIIESADLCIVPHNRNPHTDSTLPHKLFQYMACGKPVLVSDAPPLKRIVESERSGLVFKGGDFIDMGNKMLMLLSDPAQYGENGQRAVMSKYIFEENDGVRLVEFYGRLMV